MLQKRPAEVDNEAVKEAWPAASPPVQKTTVTATIKEPLLPGGPTDSSEDSAYTQSGWFKNVLETSGSKEHPETYEEEQKALKEAPELSYPTGEKNLGQQLRGKTKTPNGHARRTHETQEQSKAPAESHAVVDAPPSLRLVTEESSDHLKFVCHCIWNSMLFFFLVLL